MQTIKDIHQGDLLTFKASDDKYKALVCTSTYKEKSPIYFTFAVLDYDNIKKPTIHDILQSNFFGIGNTKNEYFRYSDNELNTMWNIHPEIKPYHLGSYGLTIWRKDFLKFQSNFELIGNMDIVNNLDKNGNGNLNGSDWDFLKEFFNEKYKDTLKKRGQKLFKVKAILH